MAFLMTDAAKGSDAAMTLMQNMGAAPLAEEVGKAQAEKVMANFRMKKEYAAEIRKIFKL